MISESAPVKASDQAREKVCLLTISRCWEGGQSRTVSQVRYIRVREGEGEEQLSKREGEERGEQTHLNSSSCLAISCISRTLACTDLWHVKGPPQYCVKGKGRYPPLRWQKLFLLNAPKVLLSSALGQYLPSLSLGSRMNSCYFRPKALLVSDPPLLMRPTPSSCGLCPWCTLSTCPEAQAN